MDNIVNPFAEKNIHFIMDFQLFSSKYEVTVWIAFKRI